MSRRRDVAAVVQGTPGTWSDGHRLQQRLGAADGALAGGAGAPAVAAVHPGLRQEARGGGISCVAS